jgi:hypothetical protein
MRILMGRVLVIVFVLMFVLVIVIVFVIVFVIVTVIMIMLMGVFVFVVMVVVPMLAMIVQIVRRCGREQQQHADTHNGSTHFPRKVEWFGDKKCKSGLVSNSRCMMLEKFLIRSPPHEDCDAEDASSAGVDSSAAARRRQHNRATIS